jgi:hypothetical protein
MVRFPMIAGLGAIRSPSKPIHSKTMHVQTQPTLPPHPIRHPIFPHSPPNSRPARRAPSSQPIESRSPRTVRTQIRLGFPPTMDGRCRPCIGPGCSRVLAALECLFVRPSSVAGLRDVPSVGSGRVKVLDLRRDPAEVIGTGMWMAQVESSCAEWADDDLTVWNGLTASVLLITLLPARGRVKRTRSPPAVSHPKFELAINGTVHEYSCYTAPCSRRRMKPCLLRQVGPGGLRGRVREGWRGFA